MSIDVSGLASGRLQFRADAYVHLRLRGAPAVLEV